MGGFATVSRVHGYAERFDFDSQTIRGWVYDADTNDNHTFRLGAGIIGTEEPPRDRQDKP